MCSPSSSAVEDPSLTPSGRSPSLPAGNTQAHTCRQEAGHGTCTSPGGRCTGASALRGTCHSELILHTDLCGDPLFKAELFLASCPKSVLSLTAIHPPVGKHLVISGPWQVDIGCLHNLPSPRHCQDGSRGLRRPGLTAGSQGYYPIHPRTRGAEGAPDSPASPLLWAIDGAGDTGCS